MRKISMLLCCIVFLAAGCSKDPGADPGPDQRLLLSKRIVSGKLAGEFQYDDKGNLTQYTSYNPYGSGTISTQTTYTYNDKGLLTKSNLILDISSIAGSPKYDSQYTDMVYGPDQRIAEAKQYGKVSGVWQYKSRVVHTYDAQGRLTEMTRYHGNNPTPSSKSVYKYNSANNVEEEENYQYTSSFSGLSWRAQYEYDQKKNPLRDIWLMPSNVNINNIIKTTSVSFMPLQPGTPPVNTPYVSTFLFKNFNGAGYPTAVTDNEGFQINYEYK